MSYKSMINKKKFKLDENDWRDVSLLTKNFLLQEQIPWTKVIKKNRKWRKTQNKTFSSCEKVKINFDPYLFKTIPPNMSDIIKNRRLTLDISQQKLAFKSRIYLDKLIYFEKNKEVDFMSNYEIYKIIYVLDNYKELENLKYIKFPIPISKNSSSSNLNEKLNDDNDDNDDNEFNDLYFEDYNIININKY